MYKTNKTMAPHTGTWRERLSDRFVTERTLAHKKTDMIVKAWTNPSFRAQLLKDPKATLKSMDINIASGVDIEVIGNDVNKRHLVLVAPPKEGVTDADLDASLLSYPVFTYSYLTLITKVWTDPDFKCHLLENPVETLRGMGIDAPDTAVVVENTHEKTYMILSAPPAEEELAWEDLYAAAATRGTCGGLSWSISVYRR